MFGTFVPMSACYSLAIADTDPLLKCAVAVCGPRAAPYEPGHSERQVTGSVAVGPDARWLATLAVAMTGDQSILLSVEREGPLPTGAPAVEEIGLVIPRGEVAALLTLFQGIVAHARRAGVLPRRLHT
jgi:hypothetical protein